MNNTQPLLSKVNDSLPELFFFYDPVQRNIVFSNQPPELFFGAPIHIGENFSFPGVTEDSIVNNLHAAWQQCTSLKSRESSRFEVRQQMDKQVFNYHFTATGTEVDEGRQLVMFYVKKHQQEMLMEEKFKKEQNEFLDLAAHDLDAPLRKLTLLIETMESKLDSGNPDNVRPYMSRINKCLGDMRSLVDSLVTLSRVGNGNTVQTNFGLDEVVNEAAAELASQVKEKNVALRVGPNMPVIRGNRSEIRLLFRQLLSNAIIFNTGEKHPEIEINAEDLLPGEASALELPGNTNYIKIKILDNGIGILPSDTEKIFQPFVRLHGKSEFAGNGIGLAICRKIVENHEGILFAENNDGEGSRFILIIPQIIH
jgi:signal transduction histidine kinase